MDRFLEGRTAWVTGGASGMGRAIALALAEAAAHGAIGSLLAGTGEAAEGELAYLPGNAELDETRAEIEGQGLSLIHI